MPEGLSPEENQEMANLGTPESSNSIRRLEDRRNELVARHKESLTEEEKAELRGISLFSDNPRGAELHKKEILGQLNDAERTEMAKLHREREEFFADLRNSGGLRR